MEHMTEDRVQAGTEEESVQTMLIVLNWQEIADIFELLVT